MHLGIHIWTVIPEDHENEIHEHVKRYCWLKRACALKEICENKPYEEYGDKMYNLHVRHSEQKRR